MHRSIAALLLFAAAVAGCAGPTPSPTRSSGPTANGSASAPAASSATSTPAGTSASAPPSGTAPTIAIQKVLDGLDSPVDIAFRPDDATSTFIVEQTGRIRLVRDGKLLDQPFLDIRSLVLSGGERGLLGLAFLPSGDGGRFFVYYTNRDAKQTVASYDTSLDADVADPDS